MRKVKRRHPFRGIISGLLLGVSFFLFSIIYGIVFLGDLTPWVMFGLGLLIGIAFIFVPAPWGRKPPPQPTVPPAPSASTGGAGASGA